MASSSSDSAGAASGAGGSGAGAASVPPSAHPHLVHRIASCEEWDAALRCGFFKGAAIDVKDNFIHFSTSVQVKLTAQRYFAGREDLMLLTIPVDRLGSELKWDPVAFLDNEIFPHLHVASLRFPVEAVAVVHRLPLVDGAHVFPAALDSLVPVNAPMVAYTASCRFEGSAAEAEAAREEWVEWLTGGHMFEVLQGGAVNAKLVRMDVSDGSAPCYEVRYTFPSRLAFEQYNAGPALELKAAGIKKFEGKNLVYSRSVGEFQGFSPCSPFSQQ